MKDVAPVSEYQLVQLASVANTVGRAENKPVTAALQWLEAQVKDHQLPSRLFSLPTSPRERIVEWAPIGDTSQWKLILRKAEDREQDDDLMPSIAQSRYLHVDDLAQLAASADTSEPCRAALLELVARQGETPRSHAGASQSASLPAVAPVSKASPYSPGDEEAPAVALKTHKPKRRADPLAAVLAEAKRLALDPTDWQSVWAALVKLAEPASRPPPLVGYTEGEGVHYRVDDLAQPVNCLSREAFRKRFARG